MDVQRQEQEVDRNFAAFEARLPSLLRDHRDQHVLIRHGEMKSFHPTAGAAMAAGRADYEDGIFSVQEVTDLPIDLGLFSHAADPRIA